ncbi:beta-1,4-N-acetylgalactosaminyltransferase bre-4-like isoform X1 [Rhipicephalus microplus]|uniref:beta-1,4-N-acetylgalactosaminyltransferase bre-4-like isoform X1 n=1 Tax=Rhipicephalus microplus TaxID=6941 RepID=UPI002376C053
MKVPVVSTINNTAQGSEILAALVAVVRRSYLKLAVSCVLVYLMMKVCLNVSGLYGPDMNTSLGRLSVVHNISEAAAKYYNDAPTNNETPGVAGVPEDVVSDSNISHVPEQKLCPVIPPNLVGYIPTNMDVRSLDDVEDEFPDVMPGGHFRPKECTSRHRVAILIPYRNRAQHLNIFIYNIHRVLARQQIDYGVFVIEQGDSKAFNRAKLLNIGYLESTALYDYQCFVFHDIDLVPVDDRNVYTCPQRPRHMSVTIDSHSGVPYGLMFGGVSALSKEIMLRVNGYSNIYWGWGGEDDDMSFRLTHINQTILRRPGNIARYKSLKHKHGEKNPARFGILKDWKARYKTDGLNNVRYKIMDMAFRKLYTWILADLR